MTLIKNVHGVVWSMCLLIGIFTRGNSPDVLATVIIGIGNTTSVFECSKQVTVRCYGGRSFVNWQISYRVLPQTEYSAQCSDFKCDVFNNFTGRYTFTYNSTTGIADLLIDPVNFEDDDREYKCNDGNPLPLRSTVKTFPTNSSYRLLNETSAKGNEINFTVWLNCTTDNVNITWYSTATRIHQFNCPREIK